MKCLQCVFYELFKGATGLYKPVGGAGASLRKKSNRQIQNLNLPGEWLIGVGWVMNSVVIITTDV